MKTDPFDRIWPVPLEMTRDGDFPAAYRIRFTGEPLPEWLAEDFSRIKGIEIVEDAGAYEVRLKKTSLPPPAGRYELELKNDGAVLCASDAVGLSYAARTLEQIFGYFPSRWPVLKIKDAPHFKKRCFMVDMGRSVWSLQLLKRMVRILHRLKMNQLHLHLYDDELCSIRFDGLPFGTENPFSLDIRELRELVQYAEERFVEIVPELEAWGHAGSIVHHRRDLAGGVGMWDGRSFLIGRETFAIIREMTRQVAAVMPKRATIHLGLDEAKWYAAPDLPAGFTPAELVRQYHTMLKEIGREQGKELTLRVWADHEGRPIPPEIAPEIIIEPWCYWNQQKENILKSIRKYSGAGKAPWMCGAGVSGGQPRGSYHATRFWAVNAADSPNIEGVNITFWCWNDIDAKMISLFAGSHYLWNPLAKTSFSELEDYENFDLQVFPIMFGWQAAFPDADPDAIARERGPVVFLGHYHFGGRHHHPVAPTAPEAGTLAASGHDYMAEYASTE